jgi:putative phosphoesterase
MFRIGVISDTHNFLDPAVKGAFRGVRHILHGGDVGQPRLLSELEAIAPVTAVLGNTDDPWLGLRETELVELDGRKFLIHHIVQPHRLTAHLESLIHRNQPAAVVFGHTHEPFREMIDGTLYLNPGSAGRARFHRPRTVAILEVAPDRMLTRFVDLEP